MWLRYRIQVSIHFDTHLKESIPSFNTYLRYRYQSIDNLFQNFSIPPKYLKFVLAIYAWQIIIFKLKSIKIVQFSMKMNFKTSNHLFKLRKIRYQKLIWVSILFDTLFRYLFQVSVFFDTLFDTEFRNRYFLIPHRDTNFKYQYLFWYQDIDTGINTRYRYQQYLTSLFITKRIDTLGMNLRHISCL